MLFLPKFIVLFLFLAGFAGAQESSPESTVLKKILDGYDNRVRPPGNSTVKVQLFIRRISDISSNDRELTVGFTIRQYYVDPRLDFRRDSALNYVTVTDPSLIWKPDLYFSNGEIQKTHETKMIRIYNNGSVLFSQRMTVRLSCPMNLKRYPFDQQTCETYLFSYAYQKNELNLLWYEYSPLLFSSNLNLQQTHFALKNITHENGHREGSLGTYAYLVVGLDLERRSEYYLVQIYIPCTMLVIVSWMSFWINFRHQLLKSLLPLLSLIIFWLALAFLNLNLPMTNYTKAIDIWIAMCLNFIFAALMESVVVYYTSISVYRDLKLIDKTPDDGQLEKSVKTTERHLHSLIDAKSEKVDIISRFAFPSIFALFIIFYFSTY